MNKSMRESFGDALVHLGADHKELMVLDADVSSSTKTIKFGTQYPDRFYNVGVAEANLAGVAAGIAASGYRPVISAFAIFLSLKSTDQIRNAICYNNLPVIIAGGYAGLSDSFDGASHQSLIDIAIMRTLPNMTVLAAGDADDILPLLEEALETDGPVYIRMSRNPNPLIGRSEPLKIGTAPCLRKGTDLTIGACGIPVASALKAADQLREEAGISAEVLDIGSIKPLDTEAILASVRKTGVFLSVEEHSIHGGMGSAVAELLVRKSPVPMDFVGIEDCFTESGPYGELLEKYGLGEKRIADKARQLLHRCRG